ncbi:hypothetical protein EVAR_43125_1 [Eumeta japonica]|uniref:Uncharacterized protein n=1 Tax=Eumeta variegata TaxID=151549 RepID=A0A4C1XNG2_EUMVA|nr:hypothetical protein EVAR_43125_1 [Eumeta japonica]
MTSKRSVVRQIFAREMEWRDTGQTQIGQRRKRTTDSRNSANVPRYRARVSPHGIRRKCGRVGESVTNPSQRLKSQNDSIVMGISPNAGDAIIHRILTVRRPSANRLSDICKDDLLLNIY